MDYGRDEEENERDYNAAEDSYYSKLTELRIKGRSIGNYLADRTIDFGNRLR